MRTHIQGDRSQHPAEGVGQAGVHKGIEMRMFLLVDHDMLRGRTQEEREKIRAGHVNEEHTQERKASRPLRGAEDHAVENKDQEGEEKISAVL